MLANRYDRAAEAPILNTYVPINFAELYRIGAALKAAVDQAAKELATNLATFAEFLSPSEIDTKRFYDNSIGQFKDLLQEAAVNPDAMKDAGYRSRVQQRLNSLDYALLSSLKQSKEGMLARLKANQQLMLADKYNPLWHDVDFANYDTLNNGIFNDVSPIAYKSEVDLVKPYVDNLKDSFMGSRNGWIYSGVSNERTDFEVQRNLSSIHNTPQYQKHLEMLLKQGLTEDEAKKELDKTLIVAGREFAHELAVRDPWWLESAKLLMKARLAEQNNPRQLMNLTELVHLDAKHKMYENFTDMTPKEMDAVARRGIDVLSTDRLKQVKLQLDPSVIQDRLQNSFEQIYNRSKNTNVAVNYVINTLSSPLDPIIATNTYAAYGTTGVKDKHGNYRGKKSNEFILQDELAFSIMGNPDKSGFLTNANNRFTLMWNDGKFHDFIIAPETKQFTDGARVYHAKYAYVPIELFNTEEFYKPTAGKNKDDNAKSLFDEIQDAGLFVATLDEDDKDGSVVVRLDNRDNIDSKSITTKDSKKYVLVPVATVIPSSGQAASAADVQLINARHLGTETNALQNIRSEAMRFPYSNLDDDNE